MENKETASAIIGIHVEPRGERGQILSGFLWELIGTGWDIVKQKSQEDVEQSG